ncbi:MAG TPA: tetratricopeptide repeat protein [Gemmatimonadales bacterium]|nr:tetratricopeptide repeat protein [Gemmatimonadales bacterium]
MATTVEAKTNEQPAASAGRPRWYRDRQRLLLIVLGMVIASTIVAWFVMVSAERKEQFAARSLNQARMAAEAGNLPLASSELQRLITTYRGTEAANEAVITLNQVRMVNGQSELAAVGLREFLATDPPEKYVAPAYGLLGAALENAKRYAEAGTAYQQAANAASVPYLRASYLVDAGRALRLAGRREEAVKAYRTILEKYPDGPSFTEAQVRLAELTAGKM